MSYPSVLTILPILTNRISTIRPIDDAKVQGIGWNTSKTHSPTSTYLYKLFYQKDSFFFLLCFIFHRKSIHTRKLFFKTALFLHFSGLTTTFFCTDRKQPQKAGNFSENSIMVPVFSRPDLIAMPHDHAPRESIFLCKTFPRTKSSASGTLALPRGCISSQTTTGAACASPRSVFALQEEFPVK